MIGQHGLQRCWPGSLHNRGGGIIGANFFCFEPLKKDLHRRDAPRVAFAAARLAPAIFQPVQKLIQVAGRERPNGYVVAKILAHEVKIGRKALDRIIRFPFATKILLKGRHSITQRGFFAEFERAIRTEKW